MSATFVRFPVGGLLALGHFLLGRFFAAFLTMLAVAHWGSPCKRSTIYDCLPCPHLPSPSNSDDSSNRQSIHVLLFHKFKCNVLDTIVIHLRVVPFPPDSHHLLFCCHPFTVLETSIRYAINVALYTPEYASLTPGTCTVFVRMFTGYDCSVRQDLRHSYTSRTCTFTEWTMQNYYTNTIYDKLWKLGMWNLYGYT